MIFQNPSKFNANVFSLRYASYLVAKNLYQDLNALLCLSNIVWTFYSIVRISILFKPLNKSVKSIIYEYGLASNVREFILLEVIDKLVDPLG